MKISAFAPGRVELLGNHTDYNDGVVLSAALDLGVTLDGGLRDDDRIGLHSEGMDSVMYDLEAIPQGGLWSDYPLGVAAMFRQRGITLTGFEGNFRSNLPQGAGLSSSAAVEVATGVFLMRLLDVKLTPWELAKLCRKAENEFVGVNCGLLDQVSSIFGKEGHAIFLDCRAETVETVPLPGGTSLVIVNSGVKHALTGGEYNERREMCFEAARAMRVPALRDANFEMLNQTDMPEVVRRRAAHVVGENDRVFQALPLLKAGDSRGFGALMTASHESSRGNFENSTAELDALVEIAIEVPGVFGARLTGGGFGGAIVALVEGAVADAVASEIADRYHSKTGHCGTALVCHPGQGAWQANGLEGMSGGNPS